MKRHRVKPIAPERLGNPKTMPQHPKKIQILNVPENVSVQRLLDKLTIYFQKASNGGGEVLDVEYTTDVKGCAYVIFEKEEDANNILKREHVFTFDNKKYKLEVQEVEKKPCDADDEQVMLFVTTKLDTSCFSERKVRQLIFRHDFQVIRSQGCIVEIKGSFPSLVKLRTDLRDLILPQPANAVSSQSHSANKKKCERNEEFLQSGTFRKYRQPSSPDSGSDSSASSEEDHSIGQYASNVHSRSSEPEFSSNKNDNSPMPLVASPSSLPVASSNNKEGTASYIERSIHDPREATKYMSTSAGENDSISKIDASSLNSFSSHSSNSSFVPHISFMVDKWTFKYLQAFNRNCLQQFLTKYSANIKTVCFDELCEISLYLKSPAHNSQRNLSEAESAIRTQIQEIQQQLRIYHIDLTSKNSIKEEVLHRFKRLSSISVEVLVEINDHTVTVVGPSAESYNMKQYILGNGSLV